MPTPTPEDLGLAELMAQGASIGERFQSEMQHLDRLWAEGGLEAWVQAQLEQAKEEAHVGSTDAANAG